MPKQGFFRRVMSMGLLAALATPIPQVGANAARVVRAQSSQPSTRGTPAAAQSRNTRQKQEEIGGLGTGSYVPSGFRIPKKLSQRQRRIRARRVKGSW